MKRVRTLSVLILLAAAMVAPMVMSQPTTIQVWWLENAIRCTPDGTVLSTWSDDPIPPTGSIEFRVTGKAYHGDMETFYNYYPLDDFEASPFIIANGKFTAWARYISPGSGLPILDKLRGNLVIDENQETVNGDYVQYSFAFGNAEDVLVAYEYAVETDESGMWHVGTTYYTVHGQS